MKKLNLKSALALLLTLCLPLGGVALAEEAAPAEDGGLVAPVAYVSPDMPAIPDPPAPVETTVQVTAGEAAGQVTVTISDISSTGATTGLDVRAEAETDDDNKVVSTGDTLKINDSDALLDDEGKKLIEGANELTVQAGAIAENISKPVEVKTAVTDANGNPVLDANGNPEFNVSYDDSVTALNIITQQEASNEKIDVATGDLFAITSATREGDEDSYAEGFNLYNDGKQNTVNLEVRGGVYVDVSRPETNEDNTYADAWGPYVTTENGSTSKVYIDELTRVNASSREKGADVYASAMTGHATGEGSKTYMVVYDVVATATASGKDAYAEAKGLGMTASIKGDADAIVFDTVAEATGTKSAKAVAILGNATSGADVDIIAIGDTSAVATLSEGASAAQSKDDTRAVATGIEADALNGTTDIILIGEVDAISSKEAYGVTANARASDLVWDSAQKKYVENTAPGVTTIDVTGDVLAVGSTTVMGVDVSAWQSSSYNEETEKYEPGKLGGKAKVLIEGNVLALGSETHESTDHIFAVNVSDAQPNTEVNIAVLGDAVAAGKDAVGVDVSASKGGKVDVLVGGKVAGDGVAIGVERSMKNVFIDSEGKQTDNLIEFDPTAANLYVGEAEENADGRIAVVYDAVITEKEVKKTGENGEETTESTIELTQIVDEAASAKLEQAIWYIVGVNEKWQKRITATGTGAYTLDDTIYQLAHQDDDVTLSIKLPSGKKLKDIMYNDGTKAEYVKNEDGTYTVKMKRGGAMELALKLKSKSNAASASTGETAQSESVVATLADAQVVNGVKASDRPELVKAMIAVGESIDGQGAKLSVPGAQKLLSADELSAFDKLNAKDRLLVTLCAMGFADEVNAEANGLSADGKALADDVAARIAGMSDDEKKALESTVAEQFPKGTQTLDGAARDTFRFDMTVENGGAKENDRYTFFDDNGTWRLCDVETSK